MGVEAADDGVDADKSGLSDREDADGGEEEGGGPRAVRAAKEEEGERGGEGDGDDGEAGAPVEGALDEGSELAGFVPDAATDGGDGAGEAGI